MEAVFFDLDGTLLDTLPDIHAVLSEVLEKFGCPPVTMEQTRAFVGNGAQKLIERAAPPHSPIPEMLALFKEGYASCGHPLTKPFADMGGFLSVCKERGEKLAVITNKPQAAAETALDRFFPGVFDLVLGDSGSFPCKPDPASSRYAALALRVSLRGCLFVGDGETDVETARRAKMPMVAALWGYRSREQLAAAGAYCFAETPSQLLALAEHFSKIG